MTNASIEHLTHSDLKISAMFVEISTLCVLVLLSLIVLSVILVAISRYHRAVLEPVNHETVEPTEENPETAKTICRELDLLEPASCRASQQRLDDHQNEQDAAGREVETCRHEIYVATTGIGNIRKELSNDINIASQILTDILNECFYELNISAPCVSAGERLQVDPRYEVKQLENVTNILDICKEHISDINDSIPRIEKALAVSSNEIYGAGLGIELEAECSTEINPEDQEAVELLHTCLEQGSLSSEFFMPTKGNMYKENLTDSNGDVNASSECSRTTSVEIFEEVLFECTEDEEKWLNAAQHDKIEKQIFSSVFDSCTPQVSGEVQEEDEKVNKFPGGVVTINHVQVFNTLPKGVSTNEHSLECDPRFRRAMNRPICLEKTEPTSKFNTPNNSRETLVAITDIEKCSNQTHAAVFDANKYLREGFCKRNCNDEVNERVEEWVQKLQKLFSPTLRRVVDKSKCQESFVENDIVDEKNPPSLNCEANGKIIDLIENRSSDEGLSKRICKHPEENAVESATVSHSTKSSGITSDIYAENINSSSSETITVAKSVSAVDDKPQPNSDGDHHEQSPTNVSTLADKCGAERDVEDDVSNSSITSLIEEQISLLRDFIDSMDCVALCANMPPAFGAPAAVDTRPSATGEPPDAANEVQEYEVTFDDCDQHEDEARREARRSSSLFEMLHMQDALFDCAGNSARYYDELLLCNAARSETCGVRDTRETKSFVEPMFWKQSSTKEQSGRQGYSSSFGAQGSAVMTGGKVFTDYLSFRENFEKKMSQLIANKYHSGASSEKSKKEPANNTVTNCNSLDHQDSGWIKGILGSLLNNSMNVTQTENMKRDENATDEKTETVECDTNEDEDMPSSTHEGKDVNKTSSSLFKLPHHNEFSLKLIDSVDLSRKGYETNLTRCTKDKLTTENSSADFADTESTFSLEKHRDSVEILCRKSFDSAKRKSFVDDVSKNTFGQSFGVFRTCARKSSGSLGNHRDSVKLLSRKSLDKEAKDDEGDNNMDVGTFLAKHVDSVELLSKKSTGTSVLYTKGSGNEGDTTCEDICNLPYQLCWALHDVDSDEDVSVQSSKSVRNKHVEVADGNTPQRRNSALQSCSKYRQGIDVNASKEHFDARSTTSIEEGLLDDSQGGAPKGILKLNRDRSNVRSVSWKDLKNHVESGQSARVEESSSSELLQKEHHPCSKLDGNPEPPATVGKSECNNGVGSLIRLFNGTKAFNEKRRVDAEETTSDGYQWGLGRKVKESEDTKKNDTSPLNTDRSNSVDRDEVLMGAEDLSVKMLTISEKLRHAKDHVS